MKLKNMTIVCGGEKRLPTVRLAGFLAGVLLAGIIAGPGCSSTEEVVKSTPEQMFAKAKALYDDGDYLSAINEFTVLTLQSQGSAVGAESQFYLAECRYQREEYVLAAYEYGVFKRSYAANARVPDAQFKLAMSYYNLSPKFALDQLYTRKAIDEFQTFAEYYPGNPLAVEADQRIKELNTRLAQKQFETARLYVKMEYYRAALLSFDQVIEKYHDTEYAPQAYIEKVDLLMSRERYEEAFSEIKRFISRYPNSPLIERGEQMKEKIDGELNRWKRRAPKPTGASPGAANIPSSGGRP
jgi:outer membrane protein assembly factor BamD